MKRLVTDPIYEAMEFEEVMRGKAGEDPSRKVYGIAGRPGVYARVSAETALKEGSLLPGYIRAKFGDSTYYLRTFSALEQELEAAGFVKKTEEEEAARA